MGNRIKGSFVEPINNAARPGTLASLSIAVLKFSADDPFIFRLFLLVGAIMLWTLTASTFLLGLCCSITSSIILLLII
jgi:hypothetical protein